MLNNLVGKRGRPSGRRTKRSEDNIKFGFRSLDYENTDWIQQNQHSVCVQSVGYVVMSMVVPHEVIYWLYELLLASQ